MMLEKDLRIGDEVTISESNEYYGDWKGEVFTITGLNRHPIRDRRINITIADKSGIQFDGWFAEDLVKNV